MRSTITAKGQTVIPAPIRRRFKLSPADRLEWIVQDGVINEAAAQRARAAGITVVMDRCIWRDYMDFIA